MGLGDIYTSDFANNLVRGPEQRLNEGFKNLPQAQMDNLRAQSMQQANTDAAYNSPARPANVHETAIGQQYRELMGMNDPNIPPEWSQKLHQELMSTAGGPSQPQAPAYSGPMAAPSPMPDNMSSPASAGGYGLSAPGGPPTPMQPPPPPQAQMSGPPPQAQRPSPNFAVQPPARLSSSAPMTRGDVQMYEKMAPTVGVLIKDRGPKRDYLGEIAARGEQARKTETTRQGGRIDLDKIKGARQTLMKAAELAIEQGNLTEKQSKDIDDFNLGIAKLENMAKFQDKLLDVKGGAKRDEMLNNMRQAMVGLMSSRANLISSGMGSTPAGKEFLAAAQDALQGPAQILVEYEDGQRQPTSGGATSVQSSSQSGGAIQRPPLPTMAPRPGMAPQAPRAIGKPATPPVTPSPQTPPIPQRFRLKVDSALGKKGKTGTFTDMKDFDPNTMELIK